MNKKGELNILGVAIVFIIIFIIGGPIGMASFPVFPGRFFICGLVMGTFATGGGSIIFNSPIRH